MNQEFINEILSTGNLIKYFIVINVVLFLLMGYDKHEAKIQQWRVSEKALFLFALAGGSIGGIAGMYLFHHKTKKWYFKFGFPLILISQLILLLIYIF